MNTAFRRNHRAGEPQGGVPTPTGYPDSGRSTGIPAKKNIRDKTCPVSKEKNEVGRTKNVNGHSANKKKGCKDFCDYAKYFAKLKFCLDFRYRRKNLLGQRWKR